MFEWISAAGEQPDQPKRRAFYGGDGLNVTVQMSDEDRPKLIRIEPVRKPMKFEVDKKIYDDFREKCKREDLDEEKVIEAFIDYYINHVYD